MNHTKRQAIYNDQINLLVTIDRNYLFPLKTMLSSYAETHKDIKTDVFVVHSALTTEDFQYLEQVVFDTDIQIHNIKITDRYFSDTPVLERLPEESFYRLLAFLYLPESIERCLYLDPDIYIRKSLLSLYNMDLGDSYLAAAGHCMGSETPSIKQGLAARNRKDI